MNRVSAKKSAILKRVKEQLNETLDAEIKKEEAKEKFDLEKSLLESYCRIGERFTYEDHELILAIVSSKEAALISLNDGWCKGCGPGSYFYPIVRSNGEPYVEFDILKRGIKYGKSRLKRKEK